MAIDWDSRSYATEIFFVNDQLLVPKDATGKVIGEYSDTWLIVAFDAEKNVDESQI